MNALEKIKHDLTVYFQRNNITDVEQGITDLQNLLTPAILKENNLEKDSPKIILAWTALQIQEDSPYRYYKSADLGEFIYSTEMHDIIHNLGISTIEEYYLYIKKIKDALLFEYSNSIKSGIYGHTIISMTYNSNKIEGSHLSEEETTNLFETGTVFSSNNSTYIPKDVEESRGHFIMFNNMLKTIDEPLSERLIKSFHYDLKCGVFEDKANGYNIGEYKGRDNRVGNIVVASAKDTPAEMKHLLDNYQPTDLDDLLCFHVNYETIHPFQDGNGRTGRLILFRECLRLNLVPVLIYDDIKSEYIRSMNAYREINDIGRFYNLALTLQKRYLDSIKPFIADYKDDE